MTLSGGDGAPGTLEVSGGAGGVVARTDDMVQASGVLHDAAGALAAVALRAAGVGARPALLATAVLAPGTLASAEAALAGALVGPRGLVAVGVRIEALALRLRVAAAAYTTAEVGARAAVRELEVALGRFAAVAAAPFVPLVAVTSVVTVPIGVAAVQLGLPLPDSWPRAGGRLLEPVVGAVPGVLAPAGPVWVPGADVPGIAAVLAGVARVGPWLREGRAVVTASGPPVPVRPPAGVADVLERVVRCYPDAGAGAAPGTVRVEGVRGPDGHRAWVVEIPGTQDWSPRAGSNPADVTADVATMAGVSTALSATVTRGLELAGAAPDEPVLLAGHSLGGMVAAALVTDPAFTRRFRVTHVVTAGSPVGAVAVPAGVAVLTLEHDDDLVPALDGTPNPDRPDWVTVRQSPSAGRHPAQAHDARGYVTTAALVDVSADASLRAWRAGLRPFLDRPGATATSLAVVGRRVR